MCRSARLDDWICLCTPQHTGTHFVRFLLELHSRIDYWTCGRTRLDGWSMADWQLLCRLGRISFAELSALVARAPSDFPNWTHAEAARLGIDLPAKHDTRRLFHSHLSTHKPYWYSQVPTIVTVRDPLVSVIGALRRGNVESAYGIVHAFRLLSRRDPGACFWFCTDLWGAKREEALGVFEHVGLRETPEAKQFVSRWPMLNATSDGRFTKTDRPELIEARRWAIEKRRVHPSVQWWADQIRKTAIQPRLERLGYRDLAWFE